MASIKDQKDKLPPSSKSYSSPSESKEAVFEEAFLRRRPRQISAPEGSLEEDLGMGPEISKKTSLDLQDHLEIDMADSIFEPLSTAVDLSLNQGLWKKRSESNLKENSTSTGVLQTAVAKQGHAVKPRDSSEETAFSSHKFHATLESTITSISQKATKEEVIQIGTLIREAIDFQIAHDKFLISRQMRRWSTLVPLASIIGSSVLIANASLFSTQEESKTLQLLAISLSLSAGMTSSYIAILAYHAERVDSNRHSIDMYGGFKSIAGRNLRVLIQDCGKRIGIEDQILRVLFTKQVDFENFFQLSFVEMTSLYNICAMTVPTHLLPRPQPL